MHATVTGGAVAVAADDAAMRLDFDLQNRGILGAANGGEGAATAAAVALVPGDLLVLQDGGQVGVVAAAGPGPARLLTASPPGRRGRAGRGRGRRGSGAGL